MDINKLFRSGLRACRVVFDILPREEIGSPMEYMMEVLKDETLPSLNTLFPRLYRTTIHISQLIPVENVVGNGLPEVHDNYIPFRIPIKLTEGLAIFSVKSCVPMAYVPNTSQNGWLYNGIGTQNVFSTRRRFGSYSSANLYESSAAAALNYADRQLAGQITSAFRYYFYPPNILCLFASYVNDGLSLSCTFCLENDPNLISIENTAYDKVKKLFILDLKKCLYNDYKLHGTISTPNGELETKIDEWSSAEADRDELYSTYESTAHFRTSSMRTG